MTESKFKTAEDRADAICRWSKNGWRDHVVAAIREAMRDQRHVCGEAIMAMGSSSIRKVDAHLIVMKASADRHEI
jgi:hypothetical protein